MQVTMIPLVKVLWVSDKLKVAKVDFYLIFS